MIGCEGFTANYLQCRRGAGTGGRVCFNRIRPSPDDRFSQLSRKIDDFLKFGLRFVWVVDPRERRGWIHTAAGRREANDRILTTADPDFGMPLTEIFDAIDSEV